MATKAKAKTKKKPAAKAKTKPKNKTAASKGDARTGSKLEMVGKLLTREGGCTTADILKATGWPAVSVPAQAKALGLTLKKEKVDGVFRYSA